MTQDEVLQLEREFEITFPDAYRDAVTESYPFDFATEHLDTDVESLRTLNRGCRKEDPWGFPWKLNYWCFGGNGSGGFYFIDTKQSDSTVYFYFFTSIEDLDHISVTSFQEFIADVNQLEKDMAEWVEAKKQLVTDRKWWQLWIPKEWPTKPKD